MDNFSLFYDINSFLHRLMELLYQESNISISYERENQILRAKWIGPQNQNVIKRSGEVILSLFEERQCSKILNDNLLVTGSWYDSVNWVVKRLFPKIVAAGLRHLAWVMPQADIFAELSANKVTDILNDSKVVRFTNYEEAYVWLLNQRG